MLKMPKDLVWRYWLITDALLIAGISGWHYGYLLAIALCTLQVVHFGLREHWDMAAFPVQVRLAYLLLLILALWEPLRFIYLLQIIGTTAMVLFNYCFLARVMALMPWNREQALSLGLLVRTFLTAPTPGRARA